MAEKTAHKHSETIKSLTGSRLDRYAFMSDIEFILSKNMAVDIEGALNIDDVYLTLSQLKDLTQNDIDRKIHDAIK